MKDPNMPCNKNGCNATTRASCCGCPEQLEYEKKQNEYAVRYAQDFKRNIVDMINLVKAFPR